jgi:hypothetical protein
MATVVFYVSFKHAMLGLESAYRERAERAAAEGVEWAPQSRGIAVALLAAYAVLAGFVWPMTIAFNYYLITRESNDR